MKFLAFSVLLLCFYSVAGLKCFTMSDDEKSTSIEDCTSLFCFTAHFSGNVDHGDKMNQIIYGCGGINGVKNNLSCNVTGRAHTDDFDGMSLDLYCCDSDLCNSAPTYSFIGIVFVLIAKVFLL